MHHPSLLNFTLSIFLNFFYSSFLLCSGSLFTNSNWFTFEDDRAVHERATVTLGSPSPSPDVEEGAATAASSIEEATSLPSPELPSSEEKVILLDLDNGVSEEMEGGKLAEWVEWRETSTAPAGATADAPQDLLGSSLLPKHEETISDNLPPGQPEGSGQLEKIAPVAVSEASPDK